MVMKDDGEGSREEGDHRIVDLALQAVCKGTSSGSWSAGTRPKVGRTELPKWQRWHRCESCRKEFAARVTAEYVGVVAMQDTMQHRAQKAAIELQP